MRDDRVRRIETVDEIAKAKKRIIFVFRSEKAIAIYLLGKRIYCSKIWSS